MKKTKDNQMRVEFIAVDHWAVYGTTGKLELKLADGGGWDLTGENLRKPEHHSTLSRALHSAYFLARA